MKKTLPIIALVLIAVCSTQAQYAYLGTYNSQGVPDNLVANDVLSSDFVRRIAASLPENYPVPYYNPQYITTGTETNIVLSEEADVWVTFVAEGAGYKNVLGFYTYDASNPPATKPADSAITIIFPNVSAAGSGGGLIAGNKMKIGTFPAGTGIGWVLLANAWNGSSVGQGLWKLFSNPNYNPETIPALKYHNVLLNDTFTGRIVLGFEDIRRDYSSCDNDFNDAIFFITASPNTAIQLANINETIPVEGSISSGNTGGLESDGSLAEKIARRNVQKNLIHKDPQRNSINSLSKLDGKSKGDNKISTGPSLERYIPTLGPDSTDAYLSTPTDLLSITNAVEVLSVDYFNDNDERTAVCLITKTETEVYSHTKSICDRVGGASLEQVKKVFIKGQYPATLITIKREDLAIEYALSFSLRSIDEDSVEYNNLWNIEDFQSGKPYVNFQLWGQQPSQVFYLAEYILDTASTFHLMSDDYIYGSPPTVLMKSGTYEQGKFKMKILNSKKKTTSLNISGTLRNAENNGSIPYTKDVQLNGQTTQEIELETNGVFDAGLNIKEETDVLQDAIYLADGAWIANFEPENVVNPAFTIYPQDKLPNNANNYWIERGFNATGQVKNYYSVHRPLKLGINPVNLSDYNYLVFTATGDNTIEIVISRDGITEWEKQPRINVTLNSSTKKYYLDLALFIDGFSNPLGKTDINAVTFSVISANQNLIPFNFNLNQIAFSKFGSCENNQQVLATAYSKEKYQSLGTLQVLNKNQAGSNLMLSATNAIEFKPGFVSNSGSVIKAEIKNCEN